MENQETKKSISSIIAIVLAVALVFVVTAFVLHDTGVLKNISLLGETADGDEDEEKEIDLHDLNYLTVAQVKELTTEYKLTTENWKDYFEPYTEDFEYWAYDDDGNKTQKLVEQEANIGIKSQYNYNLDDVNLVFKNKKTGYTFKFKDGDWKEIVEYVDGKYVITTLDEDLNRVTMDFDIDNYECISASGSVYEYKFTDDMVYVSSIDEEGLLILTLLSEYEGEYKKTDLVVLVEHGDSKNIAEVGYRSVGYYVWNNIIE